MESLRTDLLPDRDPRQQDRGMRSFLIDVLQTLLLSLALFVGIKLIDLLLAARHVWT